MSDGTGEIFPQPEFRIDPTATPEAAGLLQSLESAILSNPRLALEALKLYTSHPDTVTAVIELLRDHGEAGLSTMSTVAAAWDAGADKELSFDEPTEHAIKVSQQFKDDQRIIDPDARAAAVRRLRIRTFANRWEDHQRHNAEQESSSVNNLVLQ